MGERERHEQGTFSWTDLATRDARASKEFYGGLFPWEFEDNPIPDDGVYVMARLGGRAAAAMFETTERHPAWASYVTVDDVDAATEKARELGANVLADPFDVMDAGRMSTIQDPTGAVFCVWEPRRAIGAEVVNGHGALSLNQLNTSDPEAAERFYGDLFGWRFDSVPDTETPYWGIYRDERLNGGMMPLPPGAPTPRSSRRAGRRWSGRWTCRAGGSSSPRTRRDRSSGCSRAASTTNRTSSPAPKGTSLRCGS